ncbi:leucine-rich repeat-containing protein 46 isoform X1 [Oenanthe melanoleuca]|uniref:leucine-rich repeat-containing protein 46 isoform X1 n=1 Tax=Oenanthe melanoleuca TaxID=2939378 RepID=UPI0024C1E1A8|nr:leucine-rich repeat-containing protein 46 isoform X1 [Oenanthe melanoleuca]XP_056368235.1 leucine-rich repeat-containing protein 46 isoform X1 [Oenanthe melanoleuca]
MAEQGDNVCGAPEDPSPGVTLSDSLVMSRMGAWGSLPSCSIRLDRERICSLGSLRGLGGVHSLYLQQNQIKKMENLEAFPNLRYSSSCSQRFISMAALGWGKFPFHFNSNSSFWGSLNLPVLPRFLCLAGNLIQKVENLQALPHLSALDLSHNLIQVLDTEELPQSLQILDLTGNQCTQQDGYRDLVLSALPNLLQLDFQPVRENTAEQEAGRGSCSSEEEEEEEDEEQRTPFTSDRDFLMELSRELVGRARQRRRRSRDEHRGRLEELRERRAVLLGLPETGDSDGDTPRWCQLRPRGTLLSPPVASGESQRAAGAIQPPGEALEKETGAKAAAGNGRLSQISRSNSQE